MTEGCIGTKQRIQSHCHALAGHYGCGQAKPPGPSMCQSRTKPAAGMTTRTESVRSCPQIGSTSEHCQTRWSPAPACGRACHARSRARTHMPPQTPRARSTLAGSSSRQWNARSQRQTW
eukprot:29139-Chlamydomonas_euryale.AAC.1